MDNNTKQYCSGCQNNRNIDKFKEGFKTCDRCRTKKSKRHHRLKELYQEAKKEYRQNNPEKDK